MRASLLVVASLLPACAGSLDGAAPSTTHGAIVDGTPATSAGATVGLMEQGYPGSFCTGTLIAPRVVVTAAHCLEGVEASWLEVAVGALDTNDVPSNRLVAAQSAAAHEDFAMVESDGDAPYGLVDENDVGVVVLATAAPATPVPVLALADVDEHVHAGTPVIVAGYGQQVDGSDDGYGQLHVASTPYVQRSAREFFAGGPGEPDSCFGDSGGPAYVDVGGARRLLGATSRGASPDAPCGEGGVYTLVSAYADWLEEQSDGLFTAPAAADDGPPPVDDDEPVDDGDDDGPGADDAPDGDDLPGAGDDDGPPTGDDGADGDGTNDDGAAPARDDASTTRDEVPGDARFDDDDAQGGCSAAGAPPPLAALLLAVGARARRRRR